jgi:DNA-binding NarL/FixJ family response regulator
VGTPGLLRQSQPTQAAHLSILIVDDSRLYRDALAELLRSRSWVERVEVAVHGPGLAQHDVTFPPTITLLHMGIEDSLRWLQHLADAQARVVVLGVRDTEAEVVACAEAGAAGYLFREDSLDSLCELIQAVSRDETICSPKTAALLLRRVAMAAAERRARRGLNLLTPREGEVLQLVEQGLANREIAQRLSIEVRTVKNHVHAILGKLEVQRRGEAAAQARSAHGPASGSSPFDPPSRGSTTTSAGSNVVVGRS